MTDSPELKSLKRNLDLWCNEEDNTRDGHRQLYEQQARSYAKQNIIDCYERKKLKLKFIACCLSFLPSSIGMLGQLTSLALINCKLQTLPPEIKNLTQLTTLNLHNNLLQSLPSEIKYLTQLTKAFLGYNQFTSLPPEIENWTKLIDLDLGDGQLQSLPPETGKLIQLRKIYLGRNQLQSLPSEIGNLRHLRLLMLFENRLSSLPPQIGNLHQLEYLDLSENQLTRIPSEMGNLSALKELKLDGNQLQDIPAEIGNLAQLKLLDLTNNQLQTLPDELAQLPATCTIKAEGNRLTRAAILAFQQAITHQRTLNPNLGPQFEFSIYEDQPILPPRGIQAQNLLIASQQNFSTLQDAITFWIKQFQITFPAGHAAWEGQNAKRFPTSASDQKFLDFHQPLLEYDELGNLLLFLDKLRRTADFRNDTSRNNFVLRVNLVLEAGCTSEPFREKLFGLAGEANSSCNDRPTIFMGQIELQRRFFCEKTDLPGCAKLVIGAKRLKLLEDITKKVLQTKQFRDDIEAILYCQIKLKDILGLPISIEGMLHGDMAGIADEDLENIVAEVLNQTTQSEDIIRILLESDFWHEKIENMHEEFATLTDEFSGKLFDIPLDNDVEYRQQSNQIMAELKEAKAALVRVKTQNWVYSSSTC